MLHGIKALFIIFFLIVVLASMVYYTNKDKNKLRNEINSLNKSIEELKESFQDILENLTEPTKPVKFFRSFLPKKTREGKIEDTSALRFGLFLNPELRIASQYSLNKQLKEQGKAPVDIIKLLESEDEKHYISGLDEVRK